MNLQNIIARSVLAALAAAALPAHAAWNVYKKEGLSIDLNGAVAAEYKTKSHKVSNAYFLRPGEIDKERELEDRRTRVGYDASASYLGIRGTQRINQDLRATGTLQLGYAADDKVMLQAANVQLDYRNLGSISMGKQHLHSAYIARTGTFHPLNAFGGASVRVDYTGIDNLTVSAFHLFPGNTSTRNPGWEPTNGNGISATYDFRFAPDHTLRLGAGYTQSKRTAPPNQPYLGDSVKAALLSAEYKYRKLTLAADVSREDEKYDFALFSATKAKSYGLKAELEITPRFTTALGYGNKTLKRTLTPMVAADPNFPYAQTKNRRYYIRGDYRMRENVSLFGRIDFRKVDNEFGQPTAKSKARDIRAGISISF